MTWGYSHRLQVVSNFGDSGKIHAHARKWAPARRRATRRGAENSHRGASPRGSIFSRVRVYFAGITKIRDYSQTIIPVIPLNKLPIWLLSRFRLKLCTDFDHSSLK